jgi:hypothetical protein
MIEPKLHIRLTPEDAKAASTGGALRLKSRDMEDNVIGR